VGSQSDGLSLHLERSVPTSPERTFAAFVDREQLVQWWGPAGFTTPSVELDVRVGGAYRIAMRPPDGAVFHLRGEFREIESPHRLAYTFQWEEPTPDDRETFVTIAFRAEDGGTRIVLDHSAFATSERYDLHKTGWIETLDRLQAWLTDASTAAPSA
jgi:uncharacterized protein YndB with AHSA1/START domain